MRLYCISQSFKMPFKSRYRPAGLPGQVGVLTLTCRQCHRRQLSVESGCRCLRQNSQKIKDKIIQSTGRRRQPTRYDRSVRPFNDQHHTAGRQIDRSPDRRQHTVNQNGKINHQSSYHIYRSKILTTNDPVSTIVRSVRPMPDDAEKCHNN